jgi:hypothetical protein
MKSVLAALAMATAVTVSPALAEVGAEMIRTGEVA